eukprot:IDg807t1
MGGCQCGWGRKENEGKERKGLRQSEEIVQTRFTVSAELQAFDDGQELKL